MHTPSSYGELIACGQIIRSLDEADAAVFVQMLRSCAGQHGFTVRVEKQRGATERTVMLTRRLNECTRGVARSRRLTELVRDISREPISAW